MSLYKLIFLQMKVNFGLSALAWYRQHDRKKFLGSIGIMLLIPVSLGPLIYLYLQIVKAAYTAFLALRQPQAVLTLGLVAAGLLVAMFGIAFVMSAFYFSDDLNFLVPLPLVPRDILGAKFIVVLINNYLLILPFYLSALWVYGVSGTPEGPLYWLTGLLLFLLLPVIPLALVTIFIIVFMRVTHLSRRRDSLRILGMVLLLVLIMGFNYFLSRIPEGNEIEFIKSLIGERAGMVNYIGRVFPPAIAATNALAGEGSEALGGLVSFLGMNGAGIVLLAYLADRFFYQGLIGGQEVSARRKISAAALGRRLSQSTSPRRAIAAREVKILLRTPIYAFNTVSVLIIVPISFVFPLLAGGGTGMETILGLLRSPAGSFSSILGAAVFIGMMAMFTPGASTAFSREGRQFWLSKVIPVEPAEQVKAKMAYSFFFAAWALPLVVAFSRLVANWSVTELAVALLLGLAMSFPAISISLLIDLLRPYLNWDNPQKAIKQNMNVLFAMVVGGGVLVLLFFAGQGLHRAGWNEWTVYGLLLLLSVVAGYVPYAVLLRIAAARYQMVGE
ncbi:MAG: putative ABC transporter permease subunit [bacterium]|jgi:ABC-2 type transport system permease protein